MTVATEESASPVPAVRVRWWLLALGLVPLIGTALLAGRLIWEQTALTWEQGPQMVGFSLAHGAGGVLLLAPFFLGFWVAIGLVLIVIDLAKKRTTDTPTWATFGLAVLLLGLLSVPSGVWQRLFIRQMASSPHAADLLIYAAYDGDFRTVKAMLSHGVSIRATDHHQWRTALHAAGAAGDLRTIQFLVSNGAEVNALDRSGDSPAELAASRGHQECATFLQEHGGKRVRGDEAQHQKASEDEVRDDIEEMNRSRPR
ncbi:MAG: ankyrin repeat domain-containing protein [Candidatus Sulfotelmatobacter sp.]